MKNITILAILGILFVGFLGLSLFKNSFSYGQNTKNQLNELSTSPISPTASITDEDSVIEITPSGFQPKSLTIKAKTSVTWINKSRRKVSINSDPHPSHTDYPPLNLGVVKDKDTISLVFETSGIFNYHDHFNAIDTGTITVE